MGSKPASVPVGRSATGAGLFLGVMTLGYAVYAADRTVLTAMLVPMANSLGLDNLQQGLLVSAQYIGVLAVVFIAGALSDHYGRWKIVLLGVSVFSLFTWLIAFSGTFYEAFAFRLVSGVGEGIFWPVAMASVADYFGQGKGFALGAFYVGFDFGGAGGTAIGGATYALTSDWRAAFLVAPLLGVIVVPGIFAARRAMTITSRKGTLGIERGAIGIIAKRDMAVILLFALLATYPTAAWQSFLPTYLKKVLGLDIPTAAFATSAVFLSGAGGKLLL
ncbi:MAG TPA: MFS transporter, partial [Nitrososphaerales archaeon]|nr:MFS transporter [Nitrososphaerales archaeon]